MSKIYLVITESSEFIGTVINNDGPKVILEKPRRVLVRVGSDGRPEVSLAPVSFLKNFKAIEVSRDLCLTVEPAPKELCDYYLQSTSGIILTS